MPRSVANLLLASALAVVTISNSPVTCSAQEAKLAALLERSPQRPNAMSYLHIPSLKKLVDDASIPSDLSDKLDEVWLISDLNVSTLRPNWEAGYAIVKKEVDAETLAKAVGGYVDVVSEKEVVWTPRESYLVPLSTTSMGFLRPADRSLLAQWLGGRSGMSESNFLKEQAKQPEQFLSLMLSVDLSNVFSPQNLARRIAGFESLAGKDANALAGVLASARGINIIVGRRSLNDCIVRVDFDQSPQVLEPFAAALLNEILNNNGTSAPEVANWKVQVDGNKLAFQGPISADSLDAVLGIFSIRGHADSVATASEAVQSSDAKPDQTASQFTSESQRGPVTLEYFGKVRAFIERVRRYSAQSTGFRAKWNEQQARRIDELPTLNVDGDMVAYGAGVSSVLRNNGTAIRSGNVAAGQVAAGQANQFGFEWGAGYGAGGGFYSGFSGQSANTALRNSMVTTTQQTMAGFGSFREALAAIDQMTANIRRLMTDRFQIQF